MARRKSEGAAILRFFDSAPIEQASFVFDIVHDLMRERQKQERYAAKPAPRTLKPKTIALAVQAKPPAPPTPQTPYTKGELSD